MSFSFKTIMSAAKGKAAVSLFIRIILATRIRHKAFGADNRGVNVRLKERSGAILNLVLTG